MFDRHQFKMLVSLNLIYYRIQSGLTQEELAKLCGLSRTNISSVEAGVHSLNFYNAYKIANVLDIPVSMLFYDPSSKTIQEV